MRERPAVRPGSPDPARPEPTAIADGVTLAQRFVRDVRENRHNRAILDRWDALGLAQGWLVAGCLFQSVWNLRQGAPPEAHIKDYDLFYFDAADLSAGAERDVQARVDRHFADLPVTIEVANQARVHLWYPDYFNLPYPPLRSAREGIDRFLVRCTCVGIRRQANRLEVYAPYGLHDLYDGVLAPNPLRECRALFLEKSASYRARWPWLTIPSASPS